MCISGVYSLSKEIDSTDSGLSTSAVDFDIKNYNHDNEIISENGKVVMPGEKISIIPRINNLGIECYLRAKISYTIDDEQFDVLNYIDGDYSSWTIKDGYYYYNSLNFESFFEKINEFKEKSEVPFDFELNSDSQIITLSTCHYNNKYRLVIHGIKE